MYKNLAKNNQNIVKKIYLFMGLFTIIGISVWIGSIFIFPYFVDEKFSSAKSVILWISLAFVIRGWYQLFYNIIVHEGKTWILMYITFGGGILNLVLNYFLIKLYGINGAAMATLFAFLFMWIVVFIYSNKISALRP
jgi:O-antigen/teichoic acid export membrane protein